MAKLYGTYEHIELRIRIYVWFKLGIGARTLHLYSEYCRYILLGREAMQILFVACVDADVHNLVPHRFHPKQIPVLPQAVHGQGMQGPSGARLLAPIMRFARVHM